MNFGRPQEEWMVTTEMTRHKLTVSYFMHYEKEGETTAILRNGGRIGSVAMRLQA